MTNLISVIMPVYNVENFITEAIESVLKQHHQQFELLIIDDCGQDNSINLCRDFDDPRIRIIHHPKNLGLSAARNTGIEHAKGSYIAFIDSDDCWHPDKLSMQFKHLQHNPHLGLSFCRSAFIDEHGQAINLFQMPQMDQISVEHLLCRNPVGNGSAAMLPKVAIMDIAFTGDNGRRQYFDENFKQSEDIECWFRLLATSRWQMAGIPEPLTYYRLNKNGLSSQLIAQFNAWEAMIYKAKIYAPDVIKNYGSHARAFQLRYIARQAVRLNDGPNAVKFIHQAIREQPLIITKEPARTLMTFSAAHLLNLLPHSIYRQLEHYGSQLIGLYQKFKIYYQCQIINQK